LVDAGAHPSLYAKGWEHTIPFEYNQALLSAIDLIGLQDHWEFPHNERKEKVALALHYVCRFQYYHGVIVFQKSVEDAMVRVENGVPCILHLHKRIVEKVMHMLYVISIYEASNDNIAARIWHAKSIEN
jgi:exonuclease III